MFMALHRIISYLGRRGCWVTAFSFAKVLFALDPMVRCSAYMFIVRGK